MKKLLDEDLRLLDLECISYKACRDEGWSLEKVDRIEKAYRVFLQVLRNVDHAHPVAPTLEIDKYWHHHILDTQKYQADCQAIFGYFVHHFPYSGVFGDDDAKAQRERGRTTVSLINQYFI